MYTSNKTCVPLLNCKVNHSLCLSFTIIFVLASILLGYERNVKLLPGTELTLNHFEFWFKYK